MNLSLYLSQFNLLFPELSQETPWSITTKAQEIILNKIKTLGSDYTIVDNVAIEISPNPHNEKYLLTKRDKLGHTILRNK